MTTTTLNKTILNLIHAPQSTVRHLACVKLARLHDLTQRSKHSPKVTRESRSSETKDSVTHRRYKTDNNSMALVKVTSILLKADRKPIVTAMRLVDGKIVFVLTDYLFARTLGVLEFSI